MTQNRLCLYLVLDQKISYMHMNTSDRDLIDQHLCKIELIIRDYVYLSAREIEFLVLFKYDYQDRDSLGDEEIDYLSYMQRNMVDRLIKKKIRDTNLNRYVWRWIDEDNWWQAQQKRFGQVCDEIIGMALCHFQDEDAAIQWFTHESESLDNQIPLRLCRNQEGIDQVRDLLNNMLKGLSPETRRR